MKNVFVAFVIAVIALSFFKCEHSVDYAPGEFAIHLLNDSNMTAVEAVKQPLDELALSQKYFISVHDLNFYRWSDHSFSLKPEAENRLRILAKSRQTVFGIPFAVVVDNERIYLGAFWYAFSSVAPTFPHIEATFALLNRPLPALTIQKSWIEGQRDMRADQRIYKALRSAGVLIE
jgi:hypothetical protein